MALLPYRQVEDIYDDDFPTLATSERGGILSFATSGGLTYLEYARNPSGAIPLGIQLNDVEWLNYEYQCRSFPRDVRVPFDNVKVATQGLFETDWIYISGQIYTGTPAYVGPSGLITDDPSFGGFRIGKFMGTLKVDPHIVFFAGLGPSRQYQEYQTHDIITENDPANQVVIGTPGYARVRIDQATIIRSQTGNNL